MDDLFARRPAGQSAIKTSEHPAVEARSSAGGGVSLAQGGCDPATVGHMERTGEVAAVIAARTGFPARRVERLRRATRLHDVGKAMVDKDILEKPGDLDRGERTEMQRHTLIGHRLLAASDDDLSWLAALIALTHHERFDGSGYPHGLVAEEIPIEGRIVAVADVFDALLSDRPYRRALALEDAVELIGQGRGTHFDPTIATLVATEAEALSAVRAY